MQTVQLSKMIEMQCPYCLCTLSIYSVLDYDVVYFNWST